MTETPNHWSAGAAMLQALTDDKFLVAWHDAVLAGDEERITLIEGCAQHRFHGNNWRQPYTDRYKEQTRYQGRP